MTAFEKFVLGLVALWFLSHAVVRVGPRLAVGLSPSVVSAAESLVTI